MHDLQRLVNLFKLLFNADYFTSNKSSIIELTDWIEKNLGGDNPFKGAVKVEVNARMNHNAGYTDIMLYKKQKQ